MKKNISSRYSAKPKKRNSRRKAKPQDQNKQKGKLLERVVAALYKSRGIKVETNVDYPTTDGERTREIDILLTANLEGLKVEYAFQCKNEAKPLDVNKIGEFVGALGDIGIPTKYGIFVSVNGFTSGAIAYAKKMGIQTLVLRGLSKDRLRSEINTAIQHNVFLIPRVDLFTITNNVEKPEYDYQFFIFMDENKQMVGVISDLIFNKWQNNEIPAQLGTHEFKAEVPQGWFQYYKGEKVEMQEVSGKVTVLATVISIDGGAENHLLINAENNKLKKFNTQAKFNQFKEGQVVPLQTFSTEAQLNDFLDSSSGIRLVIKTKLPRIIVRNTYYPFSETVVRKVFEQMRNYGPEYDQITQEQFDQELYEVSKDDLFAAGMYSLIGKKVPVITTDNDGETVDVTLLLRNKEFDKVIALKERFLSNPSELFGDLLAWAYLEKSLQLLDKSLEKTEPQKSRLIEESLNKVKAALEIDPTFLPAVNHLATISFNRKDYNEALRAVDYILLREPENLALWSDRALALIRLREFDSALEAINKAKDLVGKHESNDIDLTFILFRRSKIFYRLERYEEAWLDILQAWQIKPDFMDKNLGDNRLIEEIVNEFPSLEGILLFVEVLYFRAVEFEKLQQSDTANLVAEEAIKILSSLVKVEEVKGEPLIVGQLDENLIDEVLLRSSKRLLESGNTEMANEQIEKMKRWFRDTYNEELKLEFKTT